MGEAVQRYLTAEEVAEQLRITKKTLQNWRYKEEPYGPPYVLMGGKVLYPSAKFREWCDALDAGATTS